MSTNFDKIFTTGVQNVKSAISRALKDNMSFSCQIADIKVASESDILYPSDGDVTNWLDKLFSKELVEKQLNERALASMKAKGISPPRNPKELLLVVIVASSSDVQMGISVPTTMKVDVNELLGDFMKDRKYTSESKDTYTIAKFPSECSIKDKDDLLQQVFAVIKKRGIYVVQEDDGEDFHYDI